MQFPASVALHLHGRVSLSLPGVFGSVRHLFKKKKKDVRKKKHRGNRINKGRSCQTNEAINKNNVPRKKVETEKERGGTPPPEVLIDIITGTLML